MTLSALATRALSRALPPEAAHDLAVTALEWGVFPRPARFSDPSLRVSVMGLDLPNPLGVAAGFDKDARAFRALLRMGFGHVEVGTVTPLPQGGNRRPRLFRLREDGALINRFGFNNAGQRAVLARLERFRSAGGRGVVGVNIGANRDSADRIADYARGARAFASVADYLAVNVSSPNTPGLRDLQGVENLRKLLGGVMEALAAAPKAPPVLVKLAPDLADEDLPALVGACIAQGAAGLIVSNTTLARPPSLKSPRAGEAGGLSGRPLFAPSTRMLARVWRLSAGRLTLIGAGGVETGDQAWEKIRAGASLVQTFTGFVYRGPDMIAEILRRLAARAREEGFASVPEAVGSGADEWAGE